MRRTTLAGIAVPVLLAVLAALASVGASSNAWAAGGLGDAPPSTFVGTSRVDEKEAVSTQSDGDLWPSCWAGNGKLYSANGDGKGFSLDGPFSDIAVSEINGDPPNLNGQTVARGDQVGQTWTGSGYNRKPTGMVCVGNTLYLAVQDLSLDFNDVPAATIVKSTDGGRTWTWDRSKPMFSNHVFTTVWFADMGRGGSAGPAGSGTGTDGYVYAYGLDGNWRDSFDDSVPDPQDLFLARVPKDKLQDRKAWQFYTGDGTASRPTWSKSIADRKPVLHDGRRLYQQTYDTNHVSNLSVLGQGGVTWVPGLQRYLYASWTEYTFELYESPNPWGPWKHFESKDFGGYPWDQSQYGGYATTIPSKFVSADGRTVHVQSNVCPCGGGGANVYHYSLRKLHITPAVTGAPNDAPDGSNLAAVNSDAVPISKSSHAGRLDVLNDGDLATSEDDFDDEVKKESWWGYTWPQRHNLNRVDFTTGKVFPDGGWFDARPQVEVRRDGLWHRVAGQNITPAYPGDASAGAATTYTITFTPADGDGVRVVGNPAGSKTFTSVGEVAARYATQVADPGFEAPAGEASAWDFEGTANHGVDRGLGFSHTGRNNGWIRTSGTGWSAETQRIPVEPGHTYTFSGWTRSSANLTGGRLGVRLGANGSQVLGEQAYGASAGYLKRDVTATIPAGVHEVTLYAGFTAQGEDTYVQLDDFDVAPATS